jgi:hypothetical protein
VEAKPAAHLNIARDVLPAAVARPRQLMDW